MRNLILTGLAIVLVGSLAVAGESLSPEVLLPSPGDADSWRPSVAFGHDTYLVAWQAGRNEKGDIVGVRLDKSGKLLDQKPFAISAAKDCQELPRVAFGGGLFLVVWHDLRNGKDWDVYAARVSPDGKVLDPDGIAVAKAERNQCEPCVAWDGKNFQVLWRGLEGEQEDLVGVNSMSDSGYHIFGGRVSADGQVLDGPGISMAKSVKGSRARSMGMPAALLLPDGKLLACARSQYLQCFWRVADGKPVSEPAPPRNSKDYGSYGMGVDNPTLACNGKTVLLAWTTRWDGGGRTGGVDKSGMMVFDASGEVSGTPRSLSTTPQGFGSIYVRHPSAAWDGKRYVVAWDVSCKGKDFAYERIFMRTFAADGAPQGDDAPVVDSPEGPGYWSALASDGAGTTLIAYEKHPEKSDTPIKIGFRVLSGK